MKFAASTHLKRVGATAAIATALLSATGCGYIYQQPTTIVYSASDGVNGQINQVELRNIMVIAANKDSAGRLLGTLTNKSSSDVSITFSFASGAKTIKIPANSEIHFENNANEVVLTSAGANPGMMLEGTKISAGSDSTSLDIPVLDGTLKEYAAYLPNAASATATSSASATATATSSH